MDDRINKVINFIEGHLSIQLSLSELAQEACLSNAQFHRAFKKEIGMAPIKYIEQLKMDKALKLILLGTKKVHELTSSLGYNDYETFSRTFKKHHAIAPDDLKAIAQKIHPVQNIGPDELIIKTIEVESEEEIKSALNQVLKKLDKLIAMKDLSTEELRQAKLLSVIPKQIGSHVDADIVKNKFYIKEDKVLREELLKLKKDGDH